MEGVAAQTGTWGVVAPWFHLGLFALGSFLLLWRLEALSTRGFEGTVLGALVMPYCSGLGNLIFVFVLLREGGPGGEVLTNAFVNNMTNLTLLVGLPAIFWNLSLAGGGAVAGSVEEPSAAQRQRGRQGVLLTLLAALAFTLVLWVQGRDGWIRRGEGAWLVALFLVWQGWHVVEVLQENRRREGRLLGWILLLDLAALALGAWLSYVSIQWLVDWVLQRAEGLFSARYLGWLSGWLLVTPNAVLALYYGFRGRPEVVYSSQVGDGHICIPLCVGLYACVRPLEVPAFFTPAMAAICGAALLHLGFVYGVGRLPRWMGWILAAGYVLFVQQGLP